MSVNLNPLRYREKTFGQLYAEIQVRIGFIKQGPAANKQKDLIRSFLTEAHDTLCSDIGPQTSKKIATIQLETGSNLYDYMNDEEIENIDPSKIQSIWLKRSPEDRYLMTMGITELHRAQTDRGEPRKWDSLSGQIEVWPVPDYPYQMVIEYIQSPGRFSQDSDLCWIDSQLVKLYALYGLQMHFGRQAAAAFTQNAFQERLRLVRSDQHQNRRYFVKRQGRPYRAVTGRNGDFHLTVGCDYE